ncbi:nSTAND1 domain-containing NTPase [Halomonas mongoliensis]|uniref:nSTAND1 domain-containing NTPase n=1 Tax=Halomonas mongoliensis TaxID=321265 RepID=UPI00403AE4BD
MIDPEIGFTSDVIRDSSRFVGRSDLIRDCVRALNSPLGLLAVYGKRGVGKSSLLRQIQQRLWETILLSSVQAYPMKYQRDPAST